MLRHDDEVAKHRYFGDLLAGNRREGPHSWSVAELDLGRWDLTRRW